MFKDHAFASFNAGPTPAPVSDQYPESPLTPFTA